MTGPQPPLNEQIVQGYQYGRFERGDRLLPHRPGSPDRPTQTTPPIISYHSPNSRVEDTEPPNDRYPTNTRNASQSQYTSDLVRYFTRRELITTGLPPFNDRPEDYRAWKRSFQSAIRHLGLTYSEEMDLLVKWLGKESGEHARRLRSAHLNHPERGLMRIWARLEECYGAPEMIEDALFKRVDDFPRLSNNDLPRLRELSDLATELLSAREDGNLPGLAYLDTARGLRPFITKLPSSLQDRWLSVGSEYKERHQVTFPPFKVFVNFITQQARIKNDPSFKVNPLVGRFPSQESKQRVVSVNKTEVSPTVFNTTRRQNKDDNDPTQYCPLHKKFHSLLKCRAFREKPLKERETFIRNNGICFKCCSSTAHIAKFCRMNITCNECNSEEHNTALHPGPPPWPISIRSAAENGGEDNPPIATGVVSQCTQVCGGDLSEKSCSKICLVNVYPADQPDKTVRMYAIIDEQSNRSLVRSDFFDTFKNDGPSFPYSLKTCAGVIQTMGRRASGFQVESLDGKNSLPLPSLVECDKIPNDRSGIPTPEAALHHPHLRKIAHLIPTVEPKTPIMLLLGRDILRVHKVRQHINGPHDAPYAQKLDLGWVIVGNVCLGKFHPPTIINTLHTHISDGGRPTLFEPCPNKFEIKESFGISKRPYSTEMEDHLFQRTKDDERAATF
ncbi:unnamed protein product [Acanthosepion pharaonis]|uniref:Uncharacterized protein n=1 Tax=Acanthosepion pharaonis TaxID=158019 RepID=A0A812CRH8_ACAPH|nr:unnamed protein product [Sepia pharaonis]